MIVHSVEGGTAAERQLVNGAIYFAIEHLMPRKQNLELEINLTNLEKDTDGLHYSIEKGFHEVDLQKGLSKEDLLTALFHELVHVRQYERGHLKDNGIVKSWKGEDYIYMFNSVEQYKAFPWEEEAYRLQEEMYTTWIRT